MHTFNHPNELAAHVGQELAVSDWIVIDQVRINQFADATGDHQWIHVDPERAAESFFGGTIAHGFLTLSLLTTMLEQSITINNVSMGLNYGLNRVRFTSFVPVNSRIRAHWTLKSVEDVAGGLQLVWLATVELEGSDKPCCVAEWLGRVFPAAE